MEFSPSNKGEVIEGQGLISPEEAKSDTNKQTIGMENDQSSTEPEVGNAPEVLQEVKKEIVKKNLTPYQTDLGDFEREELLKKQQEKNESDFSKNKQLDDQNQTKQPQNETSKKSEVTFKETKNFKITNKDDDIHNHHHHYSVTDSEQKTFQSEFRGMNETQKNANPKEKTLDDLQLPGLPGAEPLMPEYSFQERPESGLENLAFDQPGHVSWDTNDPNFSVFTTLNRFQSGGLRAPATPGSMYSSESRLKRRYRAVYRNASRMTNDSHDALYRRALTLISARCNSTVPDDSKANNMHLTPRPYFYINQERPHPMPPLKVWNGYNGNVYFEPIQIVPVNDSQVSDTNSSISGTEEKNGRLLGKRALSERNNSGTIRTLSRQTTKSVSIKSGYRPVVILDKDVVLDKFGEDVNEDLTLIEGIECTGSLSTRVRPRSESRVKDKSQKRAVMYDKERICKGSVVSKFKENQLRNAKAALKVHGGKFVPSSTLAPLLRTQTQYSQSNQRLTTNSPDPFHHHLPPLDQIRATVRHMDTVNQANKAQYTKHPAVGTEIKPFIKYSPDIKAGKQTAYV